MSSFGALRDPRGYSTIESMIPMSKCDKTTASSSAENCSRPPVWRVWPVPATLETFEAVNGEAAGCMGETTREQRGREWPYSYDTGVWRRVKGRRQKADRLLH